MKVLGVGDIHGQWEKLTEAFNKFLKEGYDKIIFIGDIADGFGSDEDIIRCFNVLHAMVKTYPERVIPLIGNHDEQYMHYNITPQTRCTGYRPQLHLQIHDMLTTFKRHYRYAYGIKNYIFTHAGVQYGWLSKHFNVLDGWAEKMALDITNANHLWEIIDAVAKTHDSAIIHEVGPNRGGLDSNFGGPLWCDMKEMLDKGPYPGLQQICGHTATDDIYRFHRFEGTRHYKDTSVTYIDVLGTSTEFLTLTIED